MAKRSGRQAFLGVQWDCGSWDNLRPLCNLIIDTIGTRPLVWNFPAAPRESIRQIQDWLREIVAPRLPRDYLAAMGFAGACHPILSLEELDKELAWGIENPWGGGIAQILKTRPDILIPRTADILRPDALAMYRRRGFETLGVLAERGMSWFSRGGLRCFTCARLPAANPRQIRKAPSGDVLFMIDLSGSVTVESLKETLFLVTPWLAPAEEPSPLSASRPSSQELPDAADIRQDWSVFPTPLLRQALVVASSRGRKKRRKNDEYRDLLFGLSLATSGASLTNGNTQVGLLPEGSRLVAQMLGEVSLAGSGFDVKLAGGRFTGVARGGRDFLPQRPARSYLRIGKRDWHFSTRNSFSFEGDNGTGLREVLGIDSQEGASLSIEYSFRNNSPLLEISADIRWPVLTPEATVEEHAPLVITLRELRRSEEAEICAEAPDGSASSFRVGSSSWTVVPGALHRVPLGNAATLVFRLGPAGNRGFGLPSFRVAREGRKRFLEANPFGGWFPLPGALLSEKREKFSLLIGIEE